MLKAVEDLFHVVQILVAVARDLKAERPVGGHEGAAEVVGVLLDNALRTRA